ncbi:type VII secretion integral membrane protein EccD [Corynebacterium incognita]|uniref:Type VII secretion integral membrane protein EccD n=1 Tax=Corynebacterium incognita TaxID=2754725 RepID=A0A7G7CMY6_9CORY|nr:type VII secretion integral membrane protein EccD [Corynebacterium incognita]QNE88952.1 type VII secretion integral membrane protein EccD [Corynebacterium incognita]
MTLAHVVHLTIRILDGGYRKHLDVAVPATSALAEVVPELLELIGAPPTTRPWSAATATGRRINLALPLYATELVDGAVVVLVPEEELAAPVIRDAAESLVEGTTAGAPRGVTVLAVILGLSALAVLATTFLPWPAAWAGACGAALLCGLWRPQLRALFPFAAASGAAAAFGSVSGAESFSTVLSTPGTDVAWAAVAAAGTAAAAAAAAGALSLASPRSAAAVITFVVLTLAAGAGAALSTAVPPTPGADLRLPLGSAILLTVLVCLHLAPGIVTRAAGLKVPTLPSAGEDLAVADAVDAEVDGHARRAQLLHDGVLLALSGACLVALALLATSPLTRSSAALLALSGIAVVLHAARHHRPCQAWALYVVAITAGGALCVAVSSVTFTERPVLWAVALLAGALLALAPVWAPHIPTVEPTTRVWLERAETAAIVAVLPLAVHLLGIFALIRGLG